MSDDFLDSIYPYRNRFETHRALPEHGVEHQLILDELAQMAKEEDAKGDLGHVSGSLYHGGHEHYAFLTEAFEHFAHSNVIQRDMYPSATKLEAEIVAMTLGLFSGKPEEGNCGVLTSGGTESLLTQMYVYREWGRETKGITAPQIIIPNTAHCALDKGGHYFGIEVLHAPVGDDYRVDLEWVADHIGPNTVALVGSACNYPHGLIDDIGALGALAQEHDLGLHVDCCLGGFILPWGERIGRDIPPFDFRIPGVTSISADTHKYGYALKGTSVVMYRSKELRALQYFTAADWPGGIYLSPGMAGSRSGGLIAATWAAMLSLGVEGYRDIATAIFDAADVVRAGVESIPELAVIGDPTFLIAFQSADPDVDIYLVNDALAERGWRLNSLQMPPALHFCVTRPNTGEGLMDRFVEDLRASTAWAKEHAGETPKSGAIYGISATGADGVAMANSLLSSAMDAFYDTAP